MTLPASPEARKAYIEKKKTTDDAAEVAAAIEKEDWEELDRLLKVKEGKPPQEPRKEIYWDDAENAYVFRGSFFGGCKHSLVLCLRGASSRKPDSWTRARFSAGTQSEASFKSAAREAGLLSAPHEPDSIGKLWDAGDTWREQRQVTAHFVVDPSTHLGFAPPHEMRKLRARRSLPVVFIVRSSLDGWGLGCREFVENAQAVYDGGSVALEHVDQGFAPFVFEHKSMNGKKKADLDACCPREPYVLDRMLFRELMRNYGYQVTGQSYGVQSLVEGIFHGTESALTRFAPRIFISVEVLEQIGGGEFLGVGYYLYYMEHRPYSSVEIAQRLAEVVEMAKAGNIPLCDSEWACNWGFGKPPDRTTLPPEILGEIESAEEVDYGTLLAES